MYWKKILESKFLTSSLNGLNSFIYLSRLGNNKTTRKESQLLDGCCLKAAKRAKKSWWKADFWAVECTIKMRSFEKCEYY